ncbi:hypothetical protein D9758_013760 [Tetrapyrgos nigripes]|uniref:Uncharacterized protein n=1 Tax=Tetrapyrgos nigripes TaxID=182062 RepID=A0A8H5D4T6_9AGAR|nr:hypothetical protein D9758_013760 [Tetrapyrgos nigripes]
MTQAPSTSKTSFKCVTFPQQLSKVIKGHSLHTTVATSKPSKVIFEAWIELCRKIRMLWLHNSLQYLQASPSFNDAAITRQTSSRTANPAVAHTPSW